MHVLMCSGVVLGTSAAESTELLVMKSVSTQMTEDWARMTVIDSLAKVRRPTAVTLKRKKGRAPCCHTRNICLFPARNIYFLPAAQFMNLMQEFSKTGRQVGEGRDGHVQETEVSRGLLKVCPLLLFHRCGNCAFLNERCGFCHLRRQSALSGTHDEYHPPRKDSITPTKENWKDIKQKKAFW